VTGAALSMSKNTGRNPKVQAAVDEVIRCLHYMRFDDCETSERGHNVWKIRIESDFFFPLLVLCPFFCPVLCMATDNNALAKFKLAYCQHVRLLYE